MKNSYEHLLKSSVAALLLIMLTFQICVERGLVADAPNFLIRMLQRGETFALWDPRRVSAHVFTQFPVVAALKLGLRDIHALGFIYASWLVTTPVLLWGAALAYLRKEFLFWPFLAVFAFTYFNSQFFAICEFNMSFGVTACNLALLLRSTPNPRRSLIVLMVAAVLLCFSYASTLYFGAGLLVLAVMKWRNEDKPRMKTYWIMLALLYCVAIGSGLWEIIDPRDPTNFEQAKQTETLFADTQFWISLGVMALMFASAFALNARDKTIIAIIAGLAALTLANPMWQAMPAMDYNVRAFVSMSMFAACVALGTFSVLKIKWRNDYLIAPAFIMFACLALADIRTSIRFDAFLDAYKIALATNSGLVPFEDTVAHFPDVELFGSVWTNPILSLVLRDSTHEAVILNPVWFNGYQPFDIKTNPPDLGRYY